MHRLALGYPWVMGEKEAAKLCAFFFAGPSDWPWFAGHVCLAPLRWNTDLARPNCSPWTQNRLAVLFVLLSWSSYIKSACISVLFILSLGFDMSCLIGFKNAKAITCYCLIPRLIRSIEEIKAGSNSGLPVPIVSTRFQSWIPRDLRVPKLKGSNPNTEQCKVPITHPTIWIHLTLWSIVPISESIQEYPWMIRQLTHRIRSEHGSRRDSTKCEKKFPNCTTRRKTMGSTGPHYHAWYTAHMILYIG